MRSPQPVIAVAMAYQSLRVDLQARLQAAFDGNLNLAQIVGLAREIVAHTAPDDLALVIARLISLSDEADDSGSGAPAWECGGARAAAIDVDLTSNHPQQS